MTERRSDLFANEPRDYTVTFTSCQMTACEVCGKLVFVAWFSIAGDRRLKCGECSTPRRAEIQRMFPDHDAGDEDRTVAPATPPAARRGPAETGAQLPRLSRRDVTSIPGQARGVD